MNEESTQLEGINAIWAALKADRDVDKIFIQKTAKPERMKLILQNASRKRIIVEYVPKQKLDSMSLTEHHQGIIAVLPAGEYASFEEIVDKVFSENEKPLFVLLDGIQDPHNLGALIRTAECAGANCVIIPERRSAKMTTIAASASAGAVNFIPITKVTNMNRTIEHLQKMGTWVIGTAAESKNYDEVDYTGPTAIVMGSEGDGLHRLTEKKCDDIVGIKMYGKTSSLNVSVAAGIILFEAAKQRS